MKRDISDRQQCFQIQTPAGLQAKIHGDPNMQPETRAALAELIDAAVRSMSVPGAVATGSSDPADLTKEQIKWAMNAWSKVCQRRITEERVRSYVAEHGWPKLEEELKYWLRMSRAPKPTGFVRANSQPDECDICGANPKAGNPKHDPDCPNNPAWDGEEPLSLEEVDPIQSSESSTVTNVMFSPECQHFSKRR